MLDNIMILDIDFSGVNSFADLFGFFVTGIVDLLQAIFNAILFIIRFFLSMLTILPDRIEIIVAPFFTIIILILVYRAWKG